MNLPDGSYDDPSKHEIALIELDLEGETIDMSPAHAEFGYKK